MVRTPADFYTVRALVDAQSVEVFAGDGRVVQPAGVVPGQVVEHPPDPQLVLGQAHLQRRHAELERAPHAIACDVADPDDVERVVAEAEGLQVRHLTGAEAAGRRTRRFTPGPHPCADGV